MMNKNKLFHLTRQAGFLRKSSLALAVVLVVLGVGVSFLNTGRLDAYQDVFAPEYVGEYDEELDGFLLEESNQNAVEAAVAAILKADAPFHEKLLDIQYLLYYAPPSNAIEIPAAGSLSSTNHAIAVAFVEACSKPKDAAALQPLELLAVAEPPAPDANFALALAFENRKNDLAAITALYREIDGHDSAHARERLVTTYLDLEKYDAIEALGADPKYKEFITPYVVQEIALDRMDWPVIIKTQIPAAYEGTSMAMLALALFSGLIWALILLRFNGSLSIKAAVVKLAVPALLLGALSTHGTLLVIYWQEHQLGFVMGNEMAQQLIYCIGGIGLREELMKLLFFVPLIPFLLKRTDLEILTIAGLVGLGFAIEENINYFEHSAGLSALGRFATANFLHIALTAMCGLTLTRAVAHRAENVLQALVTFGMAVMIHGLYDAFIMVPALEDYSFLTYTVFVLMGYQYFGWLRHLRDEWKDPVSITSIFTLGIILLTGLSFGLFAWQAGPANAFQAVGNEVIGVAIILLLFYREIPETIQ
ncbi:PrsW family glutamic-type intramembrane protease [Pontiella sulfatireligans]|uniref:Protease PrsW n=1 Tax=Pontiella sulfatireligans TaxID=2750658 RepID=A0A6C2USJ3_9BACT|nr:PrsW family glutamic-type intramembrane protease [Pontiella sulfatireligans]VGO22224.1 hypothetical protein SCARR_04306 [Pontiella sulfatireligans]